MYYVIRKLTMQYGRLNEPHRRFDGRTKVQKPLKSKMFVNLIINIVYVIYNFKTLYIPTFNI